MSKSRALVTAELFAWIDHALSKDLPRQTVSFHFNLYEGHDSVHIQLMGTDRFEPGEVPEHDYWPGLETFSTGEQVFEIPFSVAGSDWKQWFATCKDMLCAYIAEGDRSGVLHASQGVGAGFVDGDMHVLWRPHTA
jgi:hypothetical protein